MSLIGQVLDMENLTDAWLRVADNRGAPGVDRVSVGRFARNWEANLRRLREMVQTNRYKAARLRRIAVPKRCSSEQRLLQIPTVGDRVLQRAVLNVVDDWFDRGFLDCSYGYRRGRGLRGAVAALLRYRDQGLGWVLDADIDDCFASLDHGLLQAFLADTIGDEAVMGLMVAWMRAGRSSKKADRGIPLGSAVSPLCCNVYLHRLDWELVRNRWAMVRYADDFVVCCGSRGQAQRTREIVSSTLEALRLQLEPSKTRLTSFNEGFEFLGVRFYRDSHSFQWQGKKVEVDGAVPAWLWGYTPEGYE